MTQEEKELLVSLLKKADDNCVLQICDDQENIYDVDWVTLDSNVFIKIKPF